mgnify:FL=1
MPTFYFFIWYSLKMDFQNLNEKQLKAVNHIDGPLLIVAGAGSGKTRTLTNRLANLLANGIAPENIIAITFTNKAANEMKERAEKILGDSDKKTFEKLFIGTFHSLGARILRKEGHLMGRTPTFTIFDNDDSKSLISKIIKNDNFPEKNKKKLSAVSLIKEFSKIKDELLDIEDIGDPKISELFGEYENALAKNNAFDFDDLIEKPVKIFQKFPKVLDKYQNQFKYVLVDEYQDTNTSQYYFVKFLAQKHRNISVVGDDQQSIFKFRGSDFRNFLNFENDWKDAKVVKLEENYRSTSNIIKSASSVIANNKFQKPKSLWTQNPEGDLVKIIEHNNADYEADWITEKIKEFITPDEKKSIVILYRTNAQSRAVEQSLIEKEMPYLIFGGIRFYDRKEIRDIVASLRYGFNPKDTVSLERLEKNFNKKIYEKMKTELPQKALELNPIELIGYILKSADYFDYLKNNFANHLERIENINALIEYAAEFKKLDDLVEKITLLQSTDNIRKRDINKYHGQFVSLMTIHMAKGLEFDAVFVTGANEGLLPHQMSLFSDSEIEEERRLMYVAMTRAKNYLYLNFYGLPSRFLYEISPELVEFSGQKSLDDEERYIELN